MLKISRAEAEALAEVHRKLLGRMVEASGVTITSMLEMTDPETVEQAVNGEVEGTCRIRFGDGLALVVSPEDNGYHVTLGIHSSRLPDDDPFQGFRFVEGKLTWKANNPQRDHQSGFTWGSK